MSSIEEKLSAIREILAQLQELKRHLKEDQSSILSQVSESKSNWDDSQMQRFSSKDYVGNFVETVGIMESQVDRCLGFLENKYSTLATHRN